MIYLESTLVHQVPIVQWRIARLLIDPNLISSTLDQASEIPSAAATCLGLTTAYAIGAASGSSQQVFYSLDSNISPEHVLENGLF